MHNILAFNAFRVHPGMMAGAAVLLLVLLSTFAATGHAQAPACDINGDGVVNLVDIALFAQLYNGGVYDPRIDLNGDGVIDLVDLALFARCF